MGLCGITAAYLSHNTVYVGSHFSLPVLNEHFGSHNCLLRILLRLRRPGPCLPTGASSIPLVTFALTYRFPN